MALALAGCAGDGPNAPVDPAAPADTGPISLVGLWTVADAGEEAGTVLRIAPKKQLSLWRTCGALTGSWAAAQDLFLGELTSGGENCQPVENPSWLRDASGYQSVGDTKILVDRNGKQLARLVPGGKPKVGSGVDPAEAAPPVITDEDRAELTRTPQVPATLTRVEPTQIVGRWVPVAAGGRAYVEFKDDRTWTGSDGCNGNGGRWTATGSSMLATAGPSTLIACDGAPVPAWLTSTAAAGLADGVLVLLDPTGAEVARLKKG
ncbi:META domain-containing protein [Virgisporangium aurantiacum]|uniref:META domain-containing protein n=1 Tax=Virgisporangium aurantiacum TaxID=175570 RepID=UPI001951A3C2|nr:META domain-containing protein [Virgisporangium aurantiacum]